MNTQTIPVFFSLLRSAMRGTKLSETEYAQFSPELMPELLASAKSHDLLHLLTLGLKQHHLLTGEYAKYEKCIFRAIYRYEQMNYEYERLCRTLEEAGIAFMPLKGSILRKYYPEAWMRTSSDIDVLVHEEDTDRAAALLVDTCGYTFQMKGSHDISLLTPNKALIELHFNLIEDGRINETAKILGSVWETSTIREGYHFWYEMPDDMFYFYHVAHMAKHFGNGGCGVRSFIDLWLLDHLDEADHAKRDALLRRGDLLKFADTARTLSKVWLEDAPRDSLSCHMEDFVLRGGVFGNTNNASMIKAAQGESKTKNFLRLVFLTRSNMALLYPQVEQKPALLPYYQVKRWFRVFDKSKRTHIKRLTDARNSVSADEISSTSELLEHLGLSDINVEFRN